MNARHAPAVSYTLGRSRFLAVLWLTVWCLGAAVTLAWWQLAEDQDHRPWLGLSALALSGLWAAWSWWHLPCGRLSWDGQSWRWHSASDSAGTVVTQLEPVLDLQRLLLIRMRNLAGMPWMVWADAATEPARWLDLRRAIYAHRGDPPERPGGGRPDVQP